MMGCEKDAGSQTLAGRVWRRLSVRMNTNVFQVSCFCWTFESLAGGGGVMNRWTEIHPNSGLSLGVELSFRRVGERLSASIAVSCLCCACLCFHVACVRVCVHVCARALLKPGKRSSMSRIHVSRLCEGLKCLFSWRVIHKYLKWRGLLCVVGQI